MPCYGCPKNKQDASAINASQRQRYQHRLARDLKDASSAPTGIISTRRARKKSAQQKLQQGHGVGPISSALALSSSSCSNVNAIIAKRRRSSLPRQQLFVPPSMGKNDNAEEETSQMSSSSLTSSSWITMSKQVHNNGSSSSKPFVERRSITPMPEATTIGGGTDALSSSSSDLIPLLLGQPGKGGPTDVNCIHKRRMNDLKKHGANPSYFMTQILE